MSSAHFRLVSFYNVEGGRNASVRPQFRVCGVQILFLTAFLSFENVRCVINVKRISEGNKYLVEV